MGDETPAPSFDVVALVRDLLFSSKISAAARLSGVRDRVTIVRNPAKLLAIDARRLIVDLNTEGNLEAAAAWKARTGGEVVGFVAHVDGDAIAAARQLGLDRVLSNGGFASNVDQLVRMQKAE